MEGRGAPERARVAGEDRAGGRRLDPPRVARHRARRGRARARAAGRPGAGRRRTPRARWPADHRQRGLGEMVVRRTRRPRDCRVPAPTGRAEPADRPHRVMQQLSGHDASFIYLETPNAPMHGGGLSIYDPSTAPGGAVTHKGILEYIEGRLHMARVFRRRLVRVPMDLDHPYWVEARDFDLEYHVRHIALPKPGDWRQLCILTARIGARPLDLNKPLWEMYVIEGLDAVDGVAPGSFGVLSKMHHAAVDGVSGMEILTATHDLTPEPADPPPPEHDWKPDPEPSPWELLARAGYNNLTQPMRWADVMRRANESLPAAQEQLTSG